MKLYGTTTSPFVRRVRVVAAEVGAPLQLVDVRGKEGEAKLRAVTPIWKMPVAELDGRVLFDSQVIAEYLVHRFGYGDLRKPPDGDPWRERNLISVIDGVLEARINVFYFERDGEEHSRAPHLAKQRARVDSGLAWLASELRGHWFTREPRIGLAEVALQTTLDWLVGRVGYPLEQLPSLERFRREHASHPSFQATDPARP